MDERITPDFRFNITASLSSDELTKRRELLKARCDTGDLSDGVLDTIMIGAMMAEGLLAVNFRRPTADQLQLAIAAQQDAPEGAQPALERSASPRPSRSSSGRPASARPTTPSRSWLTARRSGASSSAGSNTASRSRS